MGRRNRQISDDCQGGKERSEAFNLILMLLELSVRPIPGLAFGMLY